jgi:hypothetical protein
MADWKQFEQLIADIQRETAPNAEVRHNETVVGAVTGENRQLDVTIRAKIGMFPVLVVLECKRYSRAVGTEKVEAFAKKLADVRANQGVMVSNAGFAKGARALARAEGIRLLTYREATHVDWRTVFDPDSWFKLSLYQRHGGWVTVYWDPPSRDTIDDDARITVHGHAPVTLDELLTRVLDGNPRPHPVGEFKLVGTFDPPAIVETGGAIRHMRKLVIEGRDQVILYLLSIELGGGDVLDDAQDARSRYRRMYSLPWNVKEILRSRPGRELTLEEARALDAEPRPQLDRVIPGHLLKNDSLLLRIEVKQDLKGEPLP